MTTQRTARVAYSGAIHTATPVDGDHTASLRLADGRTVAEAEVVWLPPFDVGSIIALGLNYADHVKELAKELTVTTQDEPLVFLKGPGSLVGHQGATRRPAGVAFMHYECELAVVIGRTAQAVSLADAPAHIFGYTLANDVTALELLNRDPSFPQWTRAKGMPGFCPLGPVIQTDFDPATASLRTLVGGRERQNYALADMFFSPAELVHRISQDTTLQPGDVILCGTSLGAMPMKPGTEVQVVAEGIGTLANTYG